MTRIKEGIIVASEGRKKSIAFLCLTLLLLSVAPGQAQEDPLTFFKNYFVTGDYVVGGASLWRKGNNGFATADINISGVPPSVDVLAAFLYVQTAEKVQWSGIAGARFENVSLGPGVGGNSIAKSLTPNWSLAPAPCWSIAYPGARKLVTYRADVLRLLPIDNREFVSGVRNPNFRKHLVNGPHRVVVPDSGIYFGDDDEGRQERDGNGPRAVGASLVVVYRDPRQLVEKAVVIYDGVHTKRAFLPMTQTIEGFYQAALTSPQAKMTHIVGDGRPFFFERVRLNGQVIAINPFVSSAGPKWDNITFNNLSGLEGDASATIRVDPYLLPDCLQYSAIIFSTKVEDSDQDGLLDLWEQDLATPLQDPNGQPLPNLYAMGARVGPKDLFVEIGYMSAGPGTTYGGVPKPPHMHLPTLEALMMVGDAFRNAPVPIKIHFDVGNNYAADPDPFDYIIPPDLARGGEAIDETVQCTPGGEEPPWFCQFSEYPGTVGWKTGFRLVKDQLLDPTQTEEACEADPGNPDCERRFDRNRKDIFRYALFAHAIGMPKEPCLNPDGSKDADCQEMNPDFHVPRTFSGIGDFPGGDLMVTLGAFDDANGHPVGTPFMQASTLLHELGHTFGLTHGGALALAPIVGGRVPPLPAREPNCKSNYLSVMNYLFQLRGLISTDQTTGAVVTRLDLSRQRFAGLPEFVGLPELDGLGTNLDSPGQQPLYRTGWYAPLETSYLQPFQAPDGTQITLATPAKKHCDGSELLSTDVPMVRIDGTAAGGPIDWDADGVVFGNPSQDINFNGLKVALNAGSNDWANIRLNEVGGRRNTGGLFVDTRVSPPRLTMGPMSLDVGNGDIGNGDIGNGDIGNGDIGNGDIGNGDIGNGDIGNGDIGRGLFGGGDDDVGGQGEPFGEVDFEIAQALGNAPPGELRACNVGSEGCFGEGSPAVRLDWKTPSVGVVERYEIYRVEGTTVLADDDQEKVLVATSDDPPETTYVDDTVDWNTTYTYFVISVFDDGFEGVPPTRATSNFATITTPDNF
jgi:hypothetical protein